MPETSTVGVLSPLLRRLPLLGLSAGIVLALLDGLLLAFLGAHIDVGGYDLTILILGSYGATFAALGWVVGFLAQARAQLREDARIIQAQYDELQASQRKLVQYEKLASIGRMAAGVAHEVRNPLGVIRSSASLVEEALPERESELRRACSFIREEVDRLNGFVTTILDFSRPIQPVRSGVRISEVFDSALTLAGTRLAGLQIERGTDPVGVQGDPDLLVQLVLGLVVNASESVSEAGRIALRAVGDREGVYLEVADDGPGVAAEDEEHLFEPFWTRKAKGTGLGLAMAQRIAEAHGGTLRLVHGCGLGKAGDGACFRLTLPREIS